ncbi:helix-turn-helix domain-containing protein [Kribbella sp. NPDC051770]|uniref:TetR/AcrR family transcriptional regulator n=1 Tax=Kribbella sp. NPDC051770 TaxID=3155413 RepID=UPI00343266E1
MAAPVKRTYTSTLRADQARRTQQAIVAAAARLFVERGWGQATIDAVAEEAGVSRKTVFTSGGGKVDLLKLALDWSLVGDDEPVPLAERPEIAATMRLSDPETFLAGWARILTDINKRVAGLHRVLISAAGVDPAAQTLLDEWETQRWSFTAGSLVPHLQRLGALRAGLPPEQAIDIMWLHGDPIVYARLVLERRWTPEQFEVWLQDSLVRQLLAP